MMFVNVTTHYWWTSYGTKYITCDKQVLLGHTSMMITGIETTTMMIAGIGTFRNNQIYVFPIKWVYSEEYLNTFCLLSYFIKYYGWCTFNWLQVERNHMSLSMALIVLITMLLRWLDWIYTHIRSFGRTRSMWINNTNIIYNILWRRVSSKTKIQTTEKVVQLQIHIPWQIFDSTLEVLLPLCPMLLLDSNDNMDVSLYLSSLFSSSLMFSNESPNESSCLISHCFILESVFAFVSALASIFPW